MGQSVLYGHGLLSEAAEATSIIRVLGGEFS